MHRGRHPVLMKFRTGVTKDGKLTGMHLQTLRRRRRLRQLRRRQHLLHRRAADGHLRAAALQVRGGARLHQQAAVRPEARPRHAAAALRPGSAARQDRREARHGSGRAAPEERAQAEFAHGQLAARSAPSASRNASGKWSRRSDWNSSIRKLPNGRGVGLACGSYLCGAGLPIYWNKMPQSGVQLLVDRSGQVTAFCGATEIGQGSDDVLAAIVAEVLGIDPFDVRCVTGDTGMTPVDLGSYSSRVTVMMGNAAIQAAEKIKDQVAIAAAEQLGSCAGQARVRRRDGLLREPCSLTFAASGRPGRREVRHARRGRLVQAAARAGTLQGRGRGTVAGVFVHRVRGRSRGRSGHRLDHGAQDLDRARHRPHDQPGACARPGRRQRLHGAFRSAHGGAGVPPPAAEALRRAGAQDPVAPRIQEPHLARYARGRHRADRGSGPELPVRRQGSRAGAAASGDAGGGQRDLRRGRRAHRRAADHAGQGAEGIWKRRAKAKPRRVGPEHFPSVPYPGADRRAAAVGRRRRQRGQGIRENQAQGRRA